MTADGRHEQNLFYLLETPQMLYIRLVIKVTDAVTHDVHLEKSTNQRYAGVVQISRWYYQRLPYITYDK